MSRDYIAYSSFKKMVSLVENIQTLSDHILTQLFFFSLIYIKCFVMILTRTISMLLFAIIETRSDKQCCEQITEFVNGELSGVKRYLLTQSHPILLCIVHFVD